MFLASERSAAKNTTAPNQRRLAINTKIDFIEVLHCLNLQEYLHTVKALVSNNFVVNLENIVMVS